MTTPRSIHPTASPAGRRNPARWGDRSVGTEDISWSVQGAAGGSPGTAATTVLPAAVSSTTRALSRMAADRRTTVTRSTP